MTEPTERGHLLARIGITEDDAQALEHLWGSRAFVLTADDRTGSLWSNGHTALDSLDAIWHELDEADAHLYMQHGFTPHQAYVLDTNRQAQRNLYGTRHDRDRADELLATPLPRDLLVKTLMVAASPAETDTLVAALTSEAARPVTDGPEVSTGARVEMLAALQGWQIDACDCPPSVLIHPDGL